MKLNWHRDRENPYWCLLKADDGRAISLEFWHTRAAPVKCSTCGHSQEKHSSNYLDGDYRCNNFDAGYCKCLAFVAGTNPRFPVTLTLEVRFRGLVVITNGEHKTRSTKRAAWRGSKVKSGTTTSMVMLYAMPLGSLLAVARSGLPLTLKPTKRRYAHGMAVIGADELGRLAVAVDAALEAGEWAVESETPGPGLPAAVAQMEAF